jgi:hypothetical protein
MLNRQWLLSHPTHFLHAGWMYIHMRLGQGDMYSDTCCEITAEMLRDQLTPGQTWTYALDNCDDIEYFDALDLSMIDLKTCYFFQISLGSSITDTDHIYSVIAGQIYQSYYKQHSLRHVGPWDGTIPTNGYVLVPITLY